MTKNAEIEIGGIGNYYGGLALVERDEGFYWGILDYCGSYGWEKIPDYLALALMQYEAGRHSPVEGEDA